MKALFASLAAVVAVLVVPVAVAAPVPRGFVGVLADGPLMGNGYELRSEALVMSRSGVQTMRAVFAWSDVQPYRTWDEVPAARRAFFVDRHGIPSDFRATDRIARAAARAGIDVLPVVQVAPDWATRHPGPFTFGGRYGSPPSRTEDYALLMTTMVERYGPHGDFWSTMPAEERRPVRRWQIWNEPMIPQYWSDQPFAADYSAYLRAAYLAVHAADPHAQVVLAGLPNLGPGGGAWQWLRELYGAGARGAFDAVAIHPFARSPANVLRTVARVRAVMRRAGDGAAPILVTEVSWSSRASLPRPPRLGSTDTTLAGQASRLRRVYRLLAAARARLGIETVVWAKWSSLARNVDDWTEWTGLSVMRGRHIERRPAFAALADVAHGLEHPDRTVRSRRTGKRGDPRTT